MFAQAITPLFRRDLERLKKEVEAYTQEDRLWLKAHHIPNAAGNLCLHLCGNLNTYIGAELGKTGYVRHRDLEFSLRDIPREQLLAQISDTADMIDLVLAGLPEQAFSQEYPVQLFSQPASTAHVLIHLATHLAYHLGQVNYHRRLLDV
jgi:hypothetical protein